MGYIGLGLLVLAAILSLLGEIPMFVLLFISGFLGLYCLFTMIESKLSNLGRIVFVLSLIGLAISIPELFFNVDVLGVLLKNK